MLNKMRCSNRSKHYFICKPWSHFFTCNLFVKLFPYRNLLVSSKYPSLSVFCDVVNDPHLGWDEFHWNPSHLFLSSLCHSSSQVSLLSQAIPYELLVRLGDPLSAFATEKYPLPQKFSNSYLILLIFTLIKISKPWPSPDTTCCVIALLGFKPKIVKTK